MNAYELAEGILAIEERIFLTRQEHKLFQNSANMLRQQADRIAELEKEILVWQNAEVPVEVMTELIAELQRKGLIEKAQTKQSEPVAWMEYIQGEEWEVWYVEPTDLPEGHTYKPLYLAPQTKPLSDEEIHELIVNKVTDYELCRAIEERHGIK